MQIFKNALYTLSLIFIFFYSQSVSAQQDESEDVYVDRGAVGAFGSALAKYPTLININGYITNEFFYSENGDTYFDNHYFNTFISAELNENISAEIQLEYEHAGREIDARYALMDYKFNDALIIRSGKFLIPAGDFNEYIYPEFIHKSVSRPWVVREIIPSAWGEVGIQVRGKFKCGYGDTFRPYYAAYIVNGLQGERAAGIRSLRGNSHSGNNNNYAYGANLGAEIGKNFAVNIHGYQGKYDESGELNLLIAGGGITYDNDALSFYGEFHLANQDDFVFDDETMELTNRTYSLNKYGYFGQVAYKFIGKIEPLVRYDTIVLDGADLEDRSRITFGLSYYMKRNANVKVNYEMISNKAEGSSADDLIGVQLSIGF